MLKNKMRFKKALFSENTESGALTATIIAAILAINVIIYVIVSTFSLYFTSSSKDMIVLSGNTDYLFEEAIDEGKKVKISFCYPTKEELEAHSTGAFVHKTAEEYAKRYPDFIEIEYINIITRQNHKGEDVDLKAYQTDMQGNETSILRSSVIFSSANNYKVVTDTFSSDGFSDFYTLDGSGNATSYNGEAYMASMIRWVTVSEHPTAYFTMGHSERMDSSFVNLLVSAGYYVDTVNLKEEEVPDDAALLIVSNPQSDFEKSSGTTASLFAEIERLENYIKRGGNIYVALDPYVKELPVFEEFLADKGIAFSETEGARNIVKDSNNAITTDGFTLVTEYADNEIARKVGDKVESFSDGSVIVREAAALELSKDAKPLLVTTPSSVTEAGGNQIDNSGNYTVAAYTKLAGDGKKVASLFVVSSIYASVSDALVTNGYSNKDFLYSLFENLFGKKGMPYGCSVVRADTSILENLTMGTARIYTALILAVPAALAIIGAVVVVKRKNR